MRRNTLTNKYIPKGNTASKPSLEEGEVYFNNETNSFHIGTSSGDDQIFSSPDYYEFYGFFKINANPAIQQFQIMKNTFPFNFSITRRGVGDHKIYGSDPSAYWSSDYLIGFASGYVGTDDGNNIRLISFSGGEDTDVFVFTHSSTGAYADTATGSDIKIYVHFFLPKQYLNF